MSFMTFITDPVVFWCFVVFLIIVGVLIGTFIPRWDDGSEQ